MKEKTPSEGRASLTSIGDLTSELTSKVYPRGTPEVRSSGSPTASGTTGEQSKSAARIGAPPSETGSSPHTRIATSTSAESLSRLSTGQADRALREWLRPYAVLRPVYSPNLKILEPIQYRAEGGRLEEARAFLEQFLLPADPRTISLALTEMTLLLSKAKGEDPQTEEMRAALYMSRLSAYPADVVTAVCRAWADSNKFWPAWAELNERLEARMVERRKMLAALQ